MVARSSTAKPLGVILHRGQSAFDGSPYVVIMPLGKPSKNGKTGKMLQTYILRSHVHPVMAVRNAGDAAICGDCPMRGLVSFPKRQTGKRFRACYVNVGQGPTMV